MIRSKIVVFLSLIAVFPSRFTIAFQGLTTNKFFSMKRNNQIVTATFDEVQLTSYDELKLQSQVDFNMTSESSTIINLNEKEFFEHSISYKTNNDSNHFNSYFNESDNEFPTKREIMIMNPSLILQYNGPGKYDTMPLNHDNYNKRDISRMVINTSILLMILKINYKNSILYQWVHHIRQYFTHHFTVHRIMTLPIHDDDHNNLYKDMKLYIQSQLSYNGLIIQRNESSSYIYSSYQEWCQYIDEQYSSMNVNTSNLYHIKTNHNYEFFINSNHGYPPFVPSNVTMLFNIKITNENDA
jgi:hypothetical protein